MIIPIRCFTCNNVLASKYKKYQELVKKYLPTDDSSEIISNPAEVPLETAQMKAFDELKMTRYCCRRHFVSHVNLIEKI